MAASRCDGRGRRHDARSSPSVECPPCGDRDAARPLQPARRARCPRGTGHGGGPRGRRRGARPTVNRAARVRELARRGGDPPVGLDGCRRAGGAAARRRVAPAGSHVLQGLGRNRRVAAVVADGVTAPPDPARSPYPGLASFDAHDADLFFGREDVVERCLELFGAQRFVAVVGASGSGKTSVALAGLAPRLARSSSLRPGVRPAQSLEDARDPGTRHGGTDRRSVRGARDAVPRSRGAGSVRRRDRGPPGGLICPCAPISTASSAPIPELAERLASSQVLLGPLAATICCGRCTSLRSGADSSSRKGSAR